MFIISQTALAQHTISGFVTDASSGEPLIGATVIDTISRSGTAANSFGFFSLSLPAGEVALRVSYIGYLDTVQVFDLREDTSLVFTLTTSGSLLQEVEITDQAERLAAPRMSTLSLRPKEITGVPMLMGEPDVMKVIQLLPGIQGGTEGTTGLHVRGGGPDQNLILLDGVPVYNVSHLLGFLSTFNAQAIQRVDVVKGGFPARYGGRLSSVIDIQLKEGNTQELKGLVNMGLLATQLQLEGPIGEKTSFLLSGRRTWLDLFSSIPKWSSGSGTTYNFYDLTGKINHRLSRRDRLFVSAYSSGDSFGSSTDEDNRYRMGWGNVTGALRWNRVISAKWFANLTATYSQYRFHVNTRSRVVEDSIATETQSDYISQIRDAGFNLDFDFFPNPRHALKMGVHTIYHAFQPSVARFKASGDTIQSQNVAINDEVLPGLESFAYLEDDIKFNSRWRANLGLHASAFWTEDTTYYALQPRVSLSYLLNKQSSLKASFVTMTQYLHLLSNTSVGIPTDIWVPSTRQIGPQSSWQVAAAYERKLAKNQLELVVEAYYKEINNVVQFGESSGSFLSESLDTDFLHDAQRDWQETVAIGQGWAYGAEFLLRKPLGKTTGWLAYTLSWADRQFDALNRGEIFPYKYDRRHNVSITMQHAFNGKVSMGANWVFMSGYNITLPVASYRQHSFIDFNHPALLEPSFWPLQHYTSTNNFRTPAHHRLDLSINFRKQKKRGIRTWNISVYNAYNRMNPFFLYADDNGVERRARSGNWQLVQQSLFSIIPSVSYLYEF
jgi:hypothetical protein